MDPKRTHRTQTYLTLQWFAPVSLGQGRCLLCCLPLLIVDPGADAWFPSCAASIHDHGPFGLDPSMRSMVLLCVPCDGEKNVSVSESESVGMHVGPFGLRDPSVSYVSACYIRCPGRTGRHVVRVGGRPLVSTVCTGERGGRL